MATLLNKVKNTFNIQSKHSPTTPTIPKHVAESGQHERTSSDVSVELSSSPLSSNTLHSTAKEDSKLSSSPSTVIPTTSTDAKEEKQGTSPISSSPPATKSKKEK